MNSFLKNKFTKNEIAGFGFSSLIHFLFFVLIILLSKVYDYEIAKGSPFGKGPGGAGRGGLIEANYESAPPAGSKDKTPKDERVLQQHSVQQPADADKIYTKSSSSESSTPLKEKKYTEANPNFDASVAGDLGKGVGGKYAQYGEGYGDTSGLGNLYAETTLNVKIRYPQGWQFIDQNVKSKLDGITFWAGNYNIYPPPYIHFEVQDKNFFDDRKYKYKLAMNDFMLYYNDPQEMQGEVRQDVYIRTDADEDYSIKLIIKGSVEFKAFQPVFFGMIETFHFGHKWF
ncbi:MAG: hypothetical protein Q8903_03885 [Bacteroidota bacterium]|nr:hypothetical protein [Bacteroidota bacterium]